MPPVLFYCILLLHFTLLGDLFCLGFYVTECTCLYNVYLCLGKPTIRRAFIFGNLFCLSLIRDRFLTFLTVCARQKFLAKCSNSVMVTRIGLLGSVGLWVRVLHWTLRYRGAMLSICPKMPTVYQALPNVFQSISWHCHSVSFIARDVIYTSRAYATMSVSVCLSVCL